MFLGQRFCFTTILFHRFRKDLSSIFAIRSLKGGPEPLEKEINEILGSRREDPLSDPFFWTGTKYQFGSFFVPASPLQFL